MKKNIHISILALVICLGISLPATAAEEKDPNIIVNKSRIVIEEMLQSEDNSLALDLIKKSAGLAIIPGMVKGGFVVGGSYGEGVVLAHKDGAWTGPAFVYTAAGSFGLQIGAQSVDLILVVIGRETMKSFLKSKFKLGADAAFAAGPIGAQATAAADILLKGGIYSYSRAKGAFAGISLEGATVGVKRDLNRAYYKTTESTREILWGKVHPQPSGRDLTAVLNRIK